MKNFCAIGSPLLLALSSSVSFAVDKTITLPVPGINCLSCPYMVEQSLSTVEGVEADEADLETHTAQVTFDDAIVSVDDVLGATAAIGYETSVLTTGEDS